MAWFLTGMPGDRLGGCSAFSAQEEALAHGADPMTTTACTAQARGASPAD